MSSDGRTYFFIPASWQLYIQMQIDRLSVSVKSTLKLKKYLLINPIFIESIL